MKKKNLIWLRKLHGMLHEKQLAREKKYFDDHIDKIGRKESLRLAKQSQTAEEDYPVDFVVTWVDGSDPKWLAERNIFFRQQQQKTEIQYRSKIS